MVGVYRNNKCELVEMGLTKSLREWKECGVWFIIFRVVKFFLKIFVFCFFVEEVFRKLKIYFKIEFYIFI